MDQSTPASTPNGLANFRFRVAGCGTALPEEALNNAELAQQLGVQEDWIHTRCGVETRYRSQVHETTLSLAVQAAKMALESAVEFRPDFLICSTFTPEYLLCPTAPAIAHQLGLGLIGGYDLNAACSGAVMGFLTSIGLLASGFTKRVLLVCSDTATKYLSDKDVNTRILMSDGAAAIALESNANCQSHILSWITGSDGSGMSFFHVPQGGSASPLSDPDSDREQATVKMEGRALYRFALDKGAELIEGLCRAAGVAQSTVKWVIVHQANIRIIRGMQERVQIPADRWVVNIHAVGNTVAASIPLALASCLEQKLFSQGDLILVAGFGAGLTWAGFLMQW